MLADGPYLSALSHSHQYNDTLGRHIETYLLPDRKRVVTTNALPRHTDYIASIDVAGGENLFPTQLFVCTSAHPKEKSCCPHTHDRTTRT